jgi:hypothetical protein
MYHCFFKQSLNKTAENVKPKKKKRTPINITEGEHTFLNNDDFF